MGQVAWFLSFFKKQLYGDHSIGAFHCTWVGFYYPACCSEYALKKKKGPWTKTTRLIVLLNNLFFPFSASYVKPGEKEQA